MVQTRRQWSSWRDQGFDESDSEPEGQCDECERENNDEANTSSESLYTNAPSSIYRYNDRCKKHRMADDEPYTETVTAYRRRKPRS